MVVDQTDMLKLENFDLEKPEVISTTVEFNSAASEEIKMQIKFSKPKLKEEIKIQNVELTSRHGTSGAKRKELF
jgi:hypothetical protein